MARDATLRVTAGHPGVGDQVVIEWKHRVARYYSLEAASGLELLVVPGVLE